MIYVDGGWGCASEKCVYQQQQGWGSVLSTKDHGMYCTRNDRHRSDTPGAINNGYLPGRTIQFWKSLGTRNDVWHHEKPLAMWDRFDGNIPIPEKPRKAAGCEPDMCRFAAGTARAGWGMSSTQRGSSPGTYWSWCWPRDFDGVLIKITRFTRGFADCSW